MVVIVIYPQSFSVKNFLFLPFLKNFYIYQLCHLFCLQSWLVICDGFNGKCPL